MSNDRQLVHQVEHRSNASNAFGGLAVDMGTTGGWIFETNSLLELLDNRRRSEVPRRVGVGVSGDLSFCLQR